MVEIKERPILFSTPMVKSILDNHKTQTRRAIKVQADEIVGDMLGQPMWYIDGDPDRTIRCPYGQIGDKLWVRETWNVYDLTYDGYNGGWEVGYPFHMIPTAKPKQSCLFYKATDECPDDTKYRPAIFMPRWASRITLEITEIRVQRVQEISLEDADAEGVSVYDSTGEYGDVLDYRTLWNKINGKIRNRQFTLDDKSNRHYVKDQVGEYSWESNPWVWAISFNSI